MAILIKRYANRKLYNTETSRYITLKGIATLLDLGDEVRVVDNETGDDITQVVLSQILVDNKRAKEDPSENLLSQILSRGGDALYSAIRKSVDDATEGIGEFQDRFREFVGQSDARSRGGRGFAWDPQRAGRPDEGAASSGPGPRGAEQLDRIVAESVRRAIESLDLPTRAEMHSLAANLERVAKAIERLERAYLPRQQSPELPRQPSSEPAGEPTGTEPSS
jgi:polyhydroxyalkanoate synthesis repressor PhaR